MLGQPFCVCFSRYFHEIAFPSTLLHAHPDRTLIGLLALHESTALPWPEPVGVRRIHTELWNNQSGFRRHSVFHSSRTRPDFADRQLSGWRIVFEDFSALGRFHFSRGADSRESPMARRHHPFTPRDHKGPRPTRSDLHLVEDGYRGHFWDILPAFRFNVPGEFFKAPWERRPEVAAAEEEGTLHGTRPYNG
jgi:hypothetical protein